MERNGRTLVARGFLNRKPVAKEWTIDGDPWYQSLEFALVPWLRGGEETLRFWCARPTDLGVHRMKATREGEETVRIGDERVAASRGPIRESGVPPPTPPRSGNRSRT